MARSKWLIWLSTVVFVLAGCGGVATGSAVEFPATTTAPTSAVAVLPTATPADATPGNMTTTARRPLLGELFSIHGGTTMFIDVLAQVAGNTTAPLLLRFDAVLKDERCPRLVACVVRGDAVIAIVAQIGQTGQPQTLELHTDLSVMQSTVIYEGYNISLVELVPTLDNPSDTLALTGYTAKLIVTNIIAVPPTNRPEPTVVPPPTAFDACVLVEPIKMAALVGAMQGTPVSSALDAFDGKQCVFQAERAAVKIQLYIGDDATAKAIIAEAQQSGVPFSELSNSTMSVSGFSYYQGHALLVQQVNEAIFVIDVVFNRKNEPADYKQARENLSALQTIVLTRYIGVRSGQIDLPKP